MYTQGEVPPGAGSMKNVYGTRGRLKKGVPAAAEASDLLKQLYQGGVSYADYQVGRLLDGLKEQGLYEGALIVITSDHGEAFDEHNEFWDHGNTVYDETVRTPLMVKFPAGWNAGLRVGTPVSNVDLFPTLAQFTGLSHRSVDGRSLLQLIENPAAAGVPVFAEATKPHRKGAQGWQNDSMEKMVRDGDFKRIINPARETSALYNLADDPGETQDVQAEQAGPYARLGSLLDAYRAAAHPLDSPRISSARVKAELEALGYVDPEEEERLEGEAMQEE